MLLMPFASHIDMVSVNSSSSFEIGTKVRAHAPLHPPPVLQTPADPVKSRLSVLAAHLLVAQAAASEYSVPALEGTSLKETCAGHSDCVASSGEFSGGECGSGWDGDGDGGGGDYGVWKAVVVGTDGAYIYLFILF